MNGLEGFAVKGIWTVLRVLPAFLLRKYFTKARLAQLIYVDLRPRHEQVTVQLATPATARVYLQIINLSPVLIELQQAEFSLVMGGISIRTTVLKKQEFKVGEITDLYLYFDINEGQAKNIAQHQMRNPASLEGHIEFASTIQSFPRQVHGLSGIAPNYQNVNAWVNPV